ncbi:MAG: hypothetical protein ACRELV_12765 [Longimicrobiales bacterium]
MKSTVAGFVTALAIAVPAALGGALAVFSEFDDAPGGVLLGFLLIIGTVAFGGRAVQRRR